MSELKQPFPDRLQAIFADEARTHLADLEAGLLALEQAAPGAHGEPLDALLRTLHTLQGAARAVENVYLVRLCHALENACAVLRRVAQAPAAGELDLLRRGVGLARELAANAAGRTINQAGALIVQLERLGGPAPPGGGRAALGI